jgi:hypothetical protein
MPAAWSGERVTRHGPKVTLEVTMRSVPPARTETKVWVDTFYWENKLSYLGIKHVSIPVAVSVFPDKIYQPPRS